MIFQVTDLAKKYPNGVQAVDGVTLELRKGEILGILGESGSGKSTLLKLLLRLERPDRGQIVFEGRQIQNTPQARLGDFRRKVQAVFQDPYFSFDPRMKIAQALREPFEILGERDKAGIRRRLGELFELARLSPTLESRYPHELSGGECQRLAVVRALCMGPEALLCDEPVSSLDVVVRARILDFFLELQSAQGISMIFVSHDLRVIRHLSDRVAVMKEGRLCEIGTRDKIFSSPEHPHTRTLLDTLR